MPRKKLTRTEELLLAIKKHAGHSRTEAMTIRELLDRENIKTIRSHITGIAFIWRCLGTGEGGAGLIGRVKHMQTYRYYKASGEIDRMDLATLSGIYHGRAKIMPRYAPMTDETPTVIPTLSDVNIDAPVNVNLNIKVQIDCQFGWRKKDE